MPRPACSAPTAATGWRRTCRSSAARTSNATSSEKTGLPTAIDNDANLGGLAEWSVVQTDLLYWVFGGGWGGAWVDKTGQVRFPAIDWDGDDRKLHYTNEPGYGIPLDKLTLKALFYQYGASFDRFEQIAAEDLGAAPTES